MQLQYLQRRLSWVLSCTYVQINIDLEADEGVVMDKACHTKDSGGNMAVDGNVCETRVLDEQFYCNL